MCQATEPKTQPTVWFGGPNRCCEPESFVLPARCARPYIRRSDNIVRMQPAWDCSGLSARGKAGHVFGFTDATVVFFSFSGNCLDSAEGAKINSELCIGRKDIFSSIHFSTLLSGCYLQKVSNKTVLVWKFEQISLVTSEASEFKASFVSVAFGGQ